ncbi:NAD(P)-dependent oxidoreductase [Tropicibacter sp. R15_0]|uniref:NAD-dependent epimerase/dehydratase family protein n=1 Tax=Tropicibacter sp. R15_0 TaxID=2821101 RepID=UPI001ADCB92E|nr:NAD(P)-dependent oxidoreductase [Tropicibacter sp. R15_0]MBO9467686.1 NAD(P)-dependent oxidoreductase [Tropicibacter sp. R15_0]
MTDTPQAAPKKLRRLLLTGATGAMATAIRPLLSELADTVVVSGRREVQNLLPHEENCCASLDDFDAVNAAVAGCDGIIHLGGYSVEGPFGPIQDANIQGVYNLYEAARAHGHPRIVFGSSNHVVGFYPQSETIDAQAVPRPDSLYAVSKIYGEALARMYFDKFGQETAILRIGSCFDYPKSHRMLATWLSYEDFVSFCQTAFHAPKLGCPIVYGMSNNTRSFWDNSAADYLGWTPKSNSEDFVAQVQEAHPNPNPNDPLNVYHGGTFPELPIVTETKDD